MASGPIKSRQILTDLDLRNNTIYDANIPYKQHYYEYETSLDNISGAKEGDIAKIEETDKIIYYKYHNGAWVLIQDPDTELSETSTNTVQNQAVTKVILDNEKVVAAMGNDLNDRILNIDNEISTINTNVETITPLVEITYADLKTLRDTNKLVPGKQYRITDYQCTTTQENTKSAGHQFDIIVTANSTNKLNEVARACLHSGDTYFSSCNLNAWKIQYCLDNDSTRFIWAQTHSPYKITGTFTIPSLGTSYTGTLEYAGNVIINNSTYYKYYNASIASGYANDYTNYILFTSQYPTTSITNASIVDGNNALTTITVSITSITAEVQEGKGVIYRMIDEFNNECPYDFKNIQFIPYGNDSITWYAYTFNSANADGGTDLSLDGNKNAIYDNVIKPSVEGINFICFLGNNCSQNHFETGCSTSMFDGSAYNNTFGINCVANSFGIGCGDNSFASSCSENTFGKYCRDNTFGIDSSGNTFEDGCDVNSFGNVCCSNTFKTGCHNNSFINNCYENSFGTGCYDNSFGNDCHQNTFGNECYDNSFGNDNHENTFGNQFLLNIFDNGCTNNIFGNQCWFNNIGSIYYKNTLGDECKHNTFGSDCRENTFGKYCCGNLFGNECEKNTFGNGCYTNEFGDGCTSNSFGADCSANTFSSNCSTNTFVANCSDNIFINFSKNVFNINCIWNSKFCCQSVTLTTSSGSSSYTTPIKNLYIKNGVTGNITAPLNLSYQWTIAKDSNGNIVQYCEDDITVGKGTMTERPTGKTVGYQYFDTTLNKPIWYTGTTWVDSTGATV